MRYYISQDNTGPIQQLIALIDSVKPKSKTKLIALDGRGGSGKSTISELLIRCRADYKVVHLDAFPCRSDEHPFHPLGTQTEISRSRILSELIIPLEQGQKARYFRTPWWISETNLPEIIEQVDAGGVVILEGCYALSHQLRDRYDLKIWVERDVNDALTDALSRDGGEKDRIFWEQAYIPNEARYIESQKPIKCADLVIENRARKFICKLSRA